MVTSSGLRIRDGQESDIPRCLELDHQYETDFVWQMSVNEEHGRWQVNFSPQRLPRTLEVAYAADEARMQLALPPEHAFLVAVTKDGAETLGYLTLRQDAAHGIGWVQDVVVSRPYRRRRIGTRLLNIARQWAKEQHLQQLTVETTTQNYPAILFCQQAGLQFCGYNDRYFPNHDIATFFSQSLR
ncbi:MAG: GNAT family N-acetyltransferase [Anaerolineae bacterium]|nr:GNAT family N-acetyltransferase [Anaerolineae bacterium]